MLKITPIPAFENNYFWAIQPDPRLAQVIVIDPGDAKPVTDFLQQQRLTLTAILITHRHHDHISGVNELLARWPVDVYGPLSSAIPQVSELVRDNEEIDLMGITLRVLAVPGHTWEHVAYYLPDHSALFCGDTLFAGGCGRRFDDTDGIMWGSIQKLAALPDDTRLFCAHEYTLANLQFAIAVEPENTDLQAWLEQAKSLRGEGKITIPTTLLHEKRTNPFLRCQEPSIKKFILDHSAAAPESAAEVFDALRRIKDTWST